MNRWLKIVFLAVIAALAFTAPVVAQDGTVDIVGGDEAQLRELLARIVAPMYLPSSAGDAQAQIIVGALPDSLPLELPVPENGEVLGSMANLGQAGAGQVYLNVPGTTGEISEFYAQALEAAGWHEAPTTQQQSGFIPAQLPVVVYCSEDNETVLNVMMLDTGEETVPVNLFWQEAYAGACEGSPEIRSGLSPVIPGLRLPSDARMTGGASGGGSNDNSYVSATLVTEMAAEELGAFYADQLSEQGWEMTSESNTDVSAVSTWTITDDGGDSWLGILLVVDAGDNQKTAFFQVTRTAP